MAELKLAKTFDTVDGGCACVYSTNVGGNQANSTQVLYVQASPCPCPEIYPGHPPGGNPNAGADGINYVNKFLTPERGEQPPVEIDVECSCYTGEGNFIKWTAPKPANISSETLCLETSSSLPCVKPDEKYVGPPYSITNRKIYHVYKRDGYRLSDSLVLCHIGDTAVYKHPQVAQVKALQSGCNGITKVTIIERSARNKDDFRYTFLSDSIKKGIKTTFEEMLLNVIKQSSTEDGELDLGRDAIRVHKGEKNPNVRKLENPSERTDRGVELLTTDLFVNHSPDIKKRVLVGYIPCAQSYAGMGINKIWEQGTSLIADAEAILDLIDMDQVPDKIINYLANALPIDKREILLAEAERLEQEESEELSKLQEVLLSAAIGEVALVDQDVDRDRDTETDEQTEVQKAEGDAIRQEKERVEPAQKEVEVKQAKEDLKAAAEKVLTKK
jgi:hypothetical protein